MTTATATFGAIRYWVQTPLSETSRFHCWAEIILCDSGTLLIHSDYGEWAYNWSHHGRKSLRHFLCEVGDDYLVGKLTLSRPKRFNLERTVERIKADMVGMVAEGATVERLAGGQRVQIPFTAERMKEAEEDLARIAEEWGHSADLFLYECFAERSLDWLYGHACDGIAVMEPDPRCVEFVRLLWPVFVARLREEIHSEEAWTNLEDY